MNFTEVFIFWLVVQMVGLIGLPIAFRLLRNLPDRGYTLAKPLGLLLTGYTLWLLGSFGLLRNNLGGSLLAMAMVLGVGIFWYRQQPLPDLMAWFRTNRLYVLAVESIFTIAYVSWAIYKAYNPNLETAGGEKWMEIAFINANLISPSFPPQDPWLSGFGISYYYFGYVLLAMLIRLSGIVSTTAFNLLIPTLFALTLIGAYGIIANLVTIFQREDIPSPTARLTGLLGSLFVGVMGHLEGVLEVLHSRSLMPASFWKWLDILDLKVPPEGPGPWIPDRFIWWWRGSRVLNDYNLASQKQEVIDEFPFFSFMLGDVHPHVITLPFVLLAIALSLNLLLREKGDPVQPRGFSAVMATLKRSLSRLVEATGGYGPFFLYALCIGGLGFLNTWDFPIYLALLGIAYLLWRGQESLLEFFLGMGMFAFFGVILYLPFYIGFQSQAGGILPNLWNPTRLPQFVVFFGPFLVAVIGFLAVLSQSRRLPWSRNIRWTVPLAILGPVVLLMLLGLSFLVLPAGRAFIEGILRDPAVQAALKGASQSDLIREIVHRRVGNPWTFLFLGLLAGWGLAHFWARLYSDLTTSPAENFSLVLSLLGLLLPLSVEFVFLRDNFGYRMNTVFKFYFQAWVLLALASAFGVYYVGQALEGIGRRVWQGAFVVLILAGMVYPVLATLNKANNFQNQPTLDGMAWIKQVYPDDHAAILWLRENAAPGDVILEAPGADSNVAYSYRYEGRVSALTGQPALLGWGGHQSQWRGSYDEPARRVPDIELMYNGIDPETTLTLLDKYDITYVYVGPVERQRYKPNGLQKFERLMDVAFEQGDVVVYRRRE
jgi:YYY domain-containing protein